jgi:hypothetical protein
VHEERVVGEYYLIAVDAPEDMDLAVRNEFSNYSFTAIVLPTVFAIEFNRDFIIAMQHPQIKWKTNREVTNYYIVDVNAGKRSIAEGSNVFGPYSHDEFLSKRVELGVPKDLKFSRVFEDLK